jgi:hypothetical protein
MQHYACASTSTVSTSALMSFISADAEDFMSSFDVASSSLVLGREAGEMVVTGAFSCRINAGDFPSRRSGSLSYQFVARLQALKPPIAVRYFRRTETDSRPQV